MLIYPRHMPRRSHPIRIAIDTGGTFTDCIWIEPTSRQLRMLKVFSTPSDPSRAIIDALEKINCPSEHVLLHGTTVGTNTLLERKGTRTALVTTAGFEDVIEIGRQNRPKLYDFFFDRIEPLVPADLRFGIRERTASDGEILVAPTAEDLESVASRITAAKPQSIAISLLFSFANPQNELAVAEALLPLGVPLSISHQILPEFREYERTSTVVINAYLQPIMQSYLENLEHGTNQLKISRKEARAETNAGERPPGAARSARQTSRSWVAQRFSAAKSASRSIRALASEVKPRIFVMQSSAGITSLASAAREPVRTILSGPAGGVVGAAASARRSGFHQIIGFDMGGTSTDVSLVEGEITTASHTEIAGLPIGVPMLDIHTVGAGGGSLARLDAAGALRVGPESAGADPGPICYGRGTQPTVTDANLLLGRLQPDRFLGGDFTLDFERTRRITREWLKKNRSDLTLEKFAAGVIRVVNATMEKAIRVVSIERGRDPRDFALVAFGGAGGLHACALAEALGIPHVIVPAFPGALSALGILVSDVVKDYSRTVLWQVGDRLPVDRLQREFSHLKKRAAADFRGEAWPGRIQYHESADLRYRGQGYELNLPLTTSLLQKFEEEHKRRYGYAHSGREIEIVTLRLRAVIKAYVGAEAFVPGSTPTQAHSGGLSPLRSQVIFDDAKPATTIHSRDALQPGKKYHGPAIITEYSATTVIPPDKHFHLDRANNLIVSHHT